LRHYRDFMAIPLDFKISTGLKSIIGKELITDDQIAIFELVKNSWDADARKVTIIFQNIKNPRGGKPPRILVIDDGHGMSYDDLVNKWLFVGYSDKKITESNKDKNFRDKITERKRRFAGAKGVGRFSADRLGKRLDLYTKIENEDEIHHLEINWEKFEEDQEKEFQNIDVSYSKIKSLPIGDTHID